MLNTISTVVLALACIGLGLRISEYYHHRIDKARQIIQPRKLPEMWDLSKPAPAPQPLVNMQDFERLKRTGRMTKYVAGGRP